MAQQDEMPNALLGGQPEQTPDQSAGPDDSSHNEMMSGLGASFDAASMQHKKMVQATKLATLTRKTLDKLVAMGESVSPDDVIDAAGDIVGAGGDAKNMASMLADMPSSSGVGLAGWLQQKDLAFKQMEAQAKQSQAVADHQLATASLAHLLGHSVSPQAQSPSVSAPPPSATPNALAPETLQ